MSKCQRGFSICLSSFAKSYGSITISFIPIIDNFLIPTIFCFKPAESRCILSRCRRVLTNNCCTISCRRCSRANCDRICTRYQCINARSKSASTYSPCIGIIRINNGTTICTFFS